MSEPTRGLADRIYRDLSTVPWPSLTEIQARARRRSRRTAIVASMAALLVVAAVWVVARVVPGRDAAPPIDRPPATTIPREALLQPDDLGQGRLLTGEFIDEQRRTSLGFDVLGPCFVSHPATPYAGSFPLYAVKRGWRIELIEQRETRDEVQATVYLFAGDSARDAVADLRRLVLGCPEETRDATFGRGVKQTTRYAVAAERFAGDEALLIRRHEIFLEEAGQGLSLQSVFHFAVVRVDNLVAVITALTEDRDRMIQLATLAAQRLCAATPRC